MCARDCGLSQKLRFLWGFPPLDQCLSFGGWLAVCAMLMASLPVVKSLRDEVGML